MTAVAVRIGNRTSRYHQDTSCQTGDWPFRTWKWMDAAEAEDVYGLTPCRRCWPGSRAPVGPAADCPVCGESVELRSRGRMARHRAPESPLRQYCDGSGCVPGPGWEKTIEVLYREEVW